MDSSETPIELGGISLDIIDETNVPEKDYNVVSRPYSGENLILDEITSYADENTNPNAAYLFTDNTSGSGTFTVEKEERWYAFVLEEKSKVSIRLNMDASMDADVYVFSLNSAEGTLSVIGGSTNSALGEAEYYSAVLEAGTYFVGITNYAGTGNYKAIYYQTNVDVDYEVNDSVDTATDITFNKKMIGVIDCPYDIDLYKFTVSQYTWVEIVGSLPSSYGLKLVGMSTGAQCDPLGDAGNNYRFAPGTYWFKVSTNDGGYSSSVTYNLTFRKNFESLQSDGYMREGNGSKTKINILQSNDRKITYVNGNKVDISYSLYWDGSNPYGSQIYNISIMPDASTYCKSMEIAYYKESTKPIMKDYSYHSVLLMTFVSDRDFYIIDCQTSGAYAGETVIRKCREVTVLVDPQSGKLVDIVDPNYYYSFPHEGTNYIRIQRDYDTIIWKS